VRGRDSGRADAEVGGAISRLGERRADERNERRNWIGGSRQTVRRYGRLKYLQMGFSTRPVGCYVHVPDW
jgi:hypothetical protein